MFKSKGPALSPDTDFTKNLRETSFYRYGHLRSLGITGEITALAVDPTLSLLAVGTSAGVVHIFGQPAFQLALPVCGPSASGPGHSIKFLAFHCGHNRLVVVDSGSTFHTFSLQHLTDHPNPVTNPPLPVKEGSYSLWATVMAIDQPLPSHTHMFICLKDGTTLTWDLSRRMLGGLQIQNKWAEYETRMIRSGIPGRQKTAGGPMATCLAVNPRDLNIMLIGYEGGVIAYNIQKGQVDKTFEMTLPPGAPGGGSYEDGGGTLWTERTPSVTNVVWRPDGLVFAVGHQDGCISFWAYAESDKPLMVRTITHEDVNVADADEILSSGVLDGKAKYRDRDDIDIDGIPIGEAVSANREPIYKLGWASFPDQASLKALMAAQSTTTAGPADEVTQATIDYAERGETLLLILGGQSPGERPGINVIQFPAYKPPPMPKKGTAPPPSESLPLAERYAYRDSLMPTGATNYPTRTPPEDFVLLPRSNPYFNLSHDAVQIIISTSPDPTLCHADGPSARRGVEAFAFPPNRSTTVPKPLGRKSFVLPGEGEKVVAMTPAPVSSSLAAPRPASPASSGWKLPWSTPSPRPSPGLRIPTPSSIMSATVTKRSRGRRRYRLPSPLWSGHLTVLGCDIHSLPTPTFKRLISWSIESAGSEHMPRLPLHGGMAVPDLQTHGAPDVKVAKMESYRVLVTWHPDATVRFWDASPHILLLPTPLRFEYPGALPHLTISIGEYLKHPDTAHLPLAKMWKDSPARVRIKSVHLAREALECVITMVSGEVIVTKFGEAKKAGAGDDVEVLDGNSDDEGMLQKKEKDSYFPKMAEFQSSNQNNWIEEVSEIGHLARLNSDGFRPVAIFTLKRGEVLACAVSDVGFIAVAFASKSVAILDMRGPDVILREGFDEDGMQYKRKKKKHRNIQNVPGEASLVGNLKWTISGMGSDPTPRPRLIVSYVKGMTKIYTLVNSLGEWMVEAKPPTFTNESLSGPLASFVVDPHTGNELYTNAEALASAMQYPAVDPGKAKEVPPHCIWIACSQRSIRAAINFSGERIAKVELEQDELAEAYYVTRHGQKIIVGITMNGAALAWSVPFLQPIIRMDLFYGSQGRQIGRISLDDRSGDFIEYNGPLDINLRTLFNFRKPLPPRLDACTLKRAIPPQPQPLSYTWGTWLWGGAPLTGSQLDAILAGPKRPPPPKEPPPPKKPLITWGEPPKPEPKVVAEPQVTGVKRTAVNKQREQARVAGERKDVYSEMTDAANERGRYLEDLGDQLNAASASAVNYLNQARTAAMKEAAKSTAKGMFGKLM